MAHLGVTHNTEGLRRPCTAWDLFIVAGGLQCGNCLASSVPPVPRDAFCSASASDGPCPLRHEKNDTLCWIHRLQQKEI